MRLIMLNERSIEKVSLAHYVDGRFVQTGKHFDNISPVDGSCISQVPEADKVIVDQAVQAAQKAQRGWGTLPIDDRCKLLNSIASGIEKRFDDFVAAEMMDTGKSLKQASTIDIPRGVANFRFFANMVKLQASQCFKSKSRDGSDIINYSLSKPIGVVAVISPWNLPLLLLTWKVAPALALGNTVVVKPSEETPSTATLLAEVIHEVGIPAGVFNLIHGLGPDSAGEFLAAHSGVDALTFTGETRTGSELMKTAAPTIKKLSFELGGKNPALIFADCDFQAAVAGTAASTFSNSGQVCLCTERVYIERPIFKDFVAALKTKTEALRLGWPDQKETDIGPMISHKHRDKVLEYYRLAVSEGATTIIGGSAPYFKDERDQGAWVEPSIFTDLHENARFMREEVFGPVCHVTPFDNESEAVLHANNSDYGLAATIWTNNLQRTHRVAAQIEAGIVWVNCWFERDLRTPFGGRKRSGIGREGGDHSLNFYSEPTNVCIKLS